MQWEKTKKIEADYLDSGMLRIVQCIQKTSRAVVSQQAERRLRCDVIKSRLRQYDRRQSRDIFMTQRYSKIIAKTDRRHVNRDSCKLQSVNWRRVGRWPVTCVKRITFNSTVRILWIQNRVFRCEPRLNSIRCEINSSRVAMHGIVESFIKSKLEHVRKSKTNIELVRKCINHNLYFRFHDLILIFLFTCCTIHSADLIRKHHHH